MHHCFFMGHPNSGPCVLHITVIPSGSVDECSFSRFPNYAAFRPHMGSFSTLDEEKQQQKQVLYTKESVVDISYTISCLSNRLLTRLPRRCIGRAQASQRGGGVHPEVLGGKGQEDS